MTEDDGSQTRDQASTDILLLIGLLCVAAAAIATAIFTHHVAALEIIGLPLVVCYAFIPRRFWKAKNGALEIGAALFFIGLLWVYGAPFFHVQ